MKKFKTENYILIPGFAITELKLSGNELICYSLIYGFTQDNETEFAGSLNYIASALNVTKRNAKGIIDRLVEKNLVIRKAIIEQGVRLCRYQIDYTPLMKQQHPRCQNDNTPVDETTTNNTIDNPFDNDTDNIPPQTDLFGEIPAKKQKGEKEGPCLFANSRFHDFTIFEKEFDKPEFAGIDIYYYYQAISDWSASGGKKKHDWIATARNWMRSDMSKNQLHRIKSNEVDPDMIEYLHSMQQ